MQKVRDPRSGGEVTVYECLQGLEHQSWLVLIGRLSRDAARANLRSRRAPGLGRNHLSCKREYVMKEPSRCWLGAVPRYWKVVASCFQNVSFAESTSAPSAPRARIFQPILLLFFCFLALEFVYKTVSQISFIPSQNLVAFK